MHLSGRAGALTTLFLTLVSAAPLPEDGTNIDVTDKYIITLKDNVNLTQHIGFVEDVHASHSQRSQNGPVFTGLSHQYDFADYLGYAGHFDSSVIAQLRNHKDVEAIEPQQIWSTFKLVDQKHATEGLNLISHRKDLHKDDYEYDTSAGAGTYGYVVDTGINIHHVDFGGRASNGYNALKGIKFDDHFGHGTHVAGTIGSKTYGVAKKCNLIAVKVFDGRTGSTDAIMDGYGWAVKDIESNRRQANAAINLSLGGGHSAAFNKAVNKAAAKGVSTVVAAGNSGVNADETSPASASGAVTVAATDMDRVRAKFSNFGRVVALFAPGVDILSTWIGSDTTTKKLSGTSMACPHVTGLVLYLKDLHKLPSARSSKAMLRKLALAHMVKDAHGSLDEFAYNGSGV